MYEIIKTKQEGTHKMEDDEANVKEAVKCQLVYLNYKLGVGL